MLKSKNVYEETQSYIRIAVPITANEEAKVRAVAELKMFLEEYYGEAAVFNDIEQITENGNIVFRFRTEYSIRGTDYNDVNAVYAETFLPA